MAELLEWGGCVASISGALLIALRGRLSRYGWILFLVSNALWAGFGIEREAGGLIVQQVFFAAVNILGLVRWWRAGGVSHGDA